jgi:hypothetical protein
MFMILQMELFAQSVVLEFWLSLLLLLVYHYGAGGLSFDLDGNLYVTSFTYGNVLKVTPVGVVSTFATGFNGPVDIVVDCVGTLFVSNFLWQFDQ